jgi:uncharacterized membrane protein
MIPKFRLDALTDGVLAVAKKLLVINQRLHHPPSRLVLGTLGDFRVYVRRRATYECEREVVA